MYVIVKSPEDMQTVLNSPQCLSRAEVYEFLRSFGGDGLVALPGKGQKVVPSNKILSNNNFI